MRRHRKLGMGVKEPHTISFGANLDLGLLTPFAVKFTHIREIGGQRPGDVHLDAILPMVRNPQGRQQSAGADAVSQSQV